MRLISLAIILLTFALSAYVLAPSPDLAKMVEPCANPSRDAASRAVACRDLSDKRVFSRIQRYQIAQWQTLAHLDLSEWEMAWEAANRAIALEPDRPGGYRMKAKIYFAQKDYPAAAVYLRKVVARAPESYPDWGNLLFALSFGRQFRDAEAVLQSMPDWDEANPKNLVMRGMNRLQYENYAGAALDAKRALALDPGFPGALKLRRWVCESSPGDCWDL